MSEYYTFKQSKKIMKKAQNRIRILLFCKMLLLFFSQKKN